MDLLKKCQNLYQELRDLDELALFVQKKLERKDLDPKEREDLWKEEFRIGLDMSSISEDLNRSLDRLALEGDMAFVAERIRQNAARIFKEEEIK